MKTVRSAIAAFLVLASLSAYGGPAVGTLGETATKVKTTYDAARTELLVRGKRAKAAALAGDFAAWQPVNEAYMQQIATLTGLCEQSVAALTSATDVAQHETKVVVSAYTQYLDLAPSMLKARLQLLAYQNMAERLSSADRAVILKALATQYVTGE